MLNNILKCLIIMSSPGINERIDEAFFCIWQGTIVIIKSISSE